MNVFQRISCLAIMLTALVGCGWHLQGTIALPPSLHTLYLSSNDPYGQFTQQFRQSLQEAKINLVSSADQAPVTLTILSTTQSTQQTGTGQSQQTRTFNLTYTVSFALKNTDGTVIYGPTSVTTTENFSLAPEVLVDNSPQLPTLVQQAQQDAMQSILDHLGSTKARQAIDKSDSPSTYEDQPNTTTTTTSK